MGINFSLCLAVKQVKQVKTTNGLPTWLEPNSHYFKNNDADRVYTF